MAVEKNLISGSTSMLLLGLLQEKDMYGYEMMEALDSRSNHIFELKAGTLYPLLHSLEAKQFLTSYEREEGGKRKETFGQAEAGMAGICPGSERRIVSGGVRWEKKNILRRWFLRCGVKGQGRP